MPLSDESQAFLDELAEIGAPAWNEIPPLIGRSMFNGLKKYFGDPPELNSIESWRVARKILARRYLPTENNTPSPVIMYFHGGGWVLGDLESHDILCRALAIETGMQVISIHYRRPPENPFPIAAEDCFFATKAAVENAEEFGIDPRNIFVAGDSAGGNLAIAVSQQVAEQSDFDLAGQILIYPVIEPDFETESYHKYQQGFGLSRPVMQWFWSQYLGETGSSDHPLANPLQFEKLSELPATLMLLAEYDVLYSEGNKFSQALEQSGVPLELIEYPGVIHGFVHFLGRFTVARNALQDIARFVKAKTRSSN